MTTSQYRLEISGTPNLYAGIFNALLFKDTLELDFFLINNGKSDEKIKTVNLLPERTSYSITLKSTQKKIQLICQRLGIKAESLSYNREPLSAFSKLKFNSLFFFKLLYKMLIPVQWVIVYKHVDDKKWRKIIPDSNIFQADPFIVYKNNKYFVFYEELKFEDYHGYLRVGELDIENGKLINDKIILKLDYHLSYPMVFEEENTFYMIPESGHGHSIDLYECTSFPYDWHKKKTLIDNIEAVDTTPLKTKDGWYLFTSEIVDGAECNDELSLYKSEDLFNKPFKKLYDEPVISDVRKARMAGRFIQADSGLYRVSQNCGKRYGYQANISKVLQIENGYKEELIDTMKPTQGALGFHTYNKAHEIEVGDMELIRFDYKSLRRFVGGNISRAFILILRKLRH